MLQRVNRDLAPDLRYRKHIPEAQHTHQRPP